MKAWIAGALLIPVLANAGDRLSFLTVDQDNQYSALSTITCKTQASRLLKGYTYSGLITFTWKAASGDGFTTEAPFEVSPAIPIDDESLTSGLVAKLITTAYKPRVLVTFVAKAPLSPNDLVTCNARIDQGPASAPDGTVYTADVQYVDHSG